MKLVRPDSTTVPVLVSYNTSNNTITIQPQGVLDYSATFTIQLGTGLHASDGTPLAAQFNSTFTTTGTGVTTRIDAGRTSLYHSSSSGYDWAADWGFVGGTARTVTNTIAGTTSDPALYQSERYGAWQYAIAVPNGLYDIRLHFVELTYNQPSMRVFSVDVLNTATVNDVSNLDIYKMAGAQNTPWIVTIPNVTITTRSLRLKAVTNVGLPEIAAIEIIPR